jgi:hypothetical protein
LGNEESLVHSSKIEELETEILQQIKQVNGFHILHGILKNLIDDVDPKAENLFSGASGNEVGAMKSDLRDLSREYWDFLRVEDANIERHCSRFSKDMLELYPKDPFSEEEMDDRKLRGELTQLQKKYQDIVGKEVRDDLQKFRDDIVLRIGETIEGLKVAVMENTRTEAALPEVKAPSVDEVKIEAEHEGNSATEFLDKTSDVLAMGAPLVPLLSKIIPIPLPFPPLQIIQVAMIAIPILKRLLGESESDRRARQEKAEAAAAQEMKARRERDRVNWRQEIHETCKRYAEEFFDGLKSGMKKYITDVLEPLMTKAKEIVGQKDEALKALENVKSEYYAIKSEMEATLKELEASPDPSR